MFRAPHQEQEWPVAGEIEKRSASDGPCWRVKYRIGCRESSIKFGGSFRTQAEARARQRWIGGELASVRTPDLQVLAAVPDSPTLRGRLPRIGDRTVDTLRVASPRSSRNCTRMGSGGESVRKTDRRFSRVLAFAKVEPNPAKDEVQSDFPGEDKAEINPPTPQSTCSRSTESARAGQSAAGARLGSDRDSVGELEALTWGDVD